MGANPTRANRSLGRKQPERLGTKQPRWLLKEFFESRDGGKTWSHIWTMPAETGLCEESDLAELDNGDLLFVHRAEHYNGQNYLGSDRLQNVFRRNGDNGTCNLWKKRRSRIAAFPNC